MAAPAYSFDTSVREWQYQTQALNQQDLDRNFSLATTHLVKWMQAARMDMPWLGPGYRSLNQLEPPMHRRLLVGSQMVQLVYPGVLTEAVDSVVTTRCEVGDIGRTSIEFRYQIFFGTKLVAHATAMMICVGGVPGALKPTPIPADIRTLASPTAGREKASMMAALKDVSKEPPPNAYKLPLTIRFSDEDLNKHANHSAYARFFEDAKEVLAADPTAPAPLRTIAERYQAEARAQDVCEINVAPAAEGGAMDLWIMRTQVNSNGDAPGLVTRGRLVTGGEIVPEDLSEMIANSDKQQAKL